MRFALLALELAALAAAAVGDEADGGCGAEGCDGDEEMSVLQMKSREAQQGHRRAAAPLAAVEEEDAWDWLVVGGGGAGCAAAAALARAGERVAVLERGPSDLEPKMNATQYAEYWPSSVNVAGENIRWTEGVWGVVAKVLGGGTSLNGGLYFADKEAWFKENLPEVDLPKMYESYERVGRMLANPSQPTPFGLSWNQALTEAGHGTANLSKAYIEWQNGVPFVPYSTFNLTAAGGPRYSSAALLHMLGDLPNLAVLTDTLVEKINFEGKRATSVSVKSKRSRSTLKANKGIIVSAGAIFTPQLLQLSGVGERSLLRELGVPVVSELPQVGANFTDRLVVTAGFMSPTNISLTIGYTVLAEEARKTVVEGVAGGEIATQLGITSMAFVPPANRTPALRAVIAEAFSLLPESALTLFNQMLQPVALQMNTHSRGTVKAASSNAGDKPVVSANYFADPRDMESQKERFKQLMTLTDTNAMANFTREREAVNPLMAKFFAKKYPMLSQAVACFARTTLDVEYTKVIFPCPKLGMTSDAVLEEYLREYLVSSYHYFGTAAAGAVVEGPDFKVKGTEGLHVVDASVIPVPTNVNPQGTVMALGDYLGTLLARQL